MLGSVFCKHELIKIPMSLQTKIYQKENNLSIFKLLSASLKDIGQSFFLAKQLAKRDISAQYRQSYLGIIWAFVTPLTTALVWIVLNSSGVIQLTDTGMPYPLYAFTGTLIWSIVIDAINAPTQSTNSARSILSKINFPKEALLLSGIYKLLFNSSVKILLVFVFVLFYSIGLSWSMLAFPIAIFGAVFIGTTLGLLITPFGLLYKDIGRIVGFGLKFIMYVTPVVYVIPKAPGLLRTAMLYNPFTPLLVTTRDLILGQSPDYLVPFLIILGCCVPLLLLALVFYRLSIPIIVERLSA